MREMSDATSMQYDPMAASSHKRLPVESAMPGTTLKLIPLKAFHSGGQLIGQLELLLCIHRTNVLEGWIACSAVCNQLWMKTHGSA